MTIGVAAVVCVYPGFNHTGIGQPAAAAQADAVTGSEALAIDQVFGGLYGDLRTGINRALGIETFGLYIDGITRRDFSQGQLAIGVDLDVTCAGGKIPASFTPTPCSVPTSLIAPAYMPPSAEESMASCGLALPSSARAVALRVSALTSLRPVVMFRFLRGSVH